MGTWQILKYPWYRPCLSIGCHFNNGNSCGERHSTADRGTSTLPENQYSEICSLYLAVIFLLKSGKTRPIPRCLLSGQSLAVMSHFFVTSPSRVSCYVRMRYNWELHQDNTLAYTLPAKSMEYWESSMETPVAAILICWKWLGANHKQVLWL